MEPDWTRPQMVGSGAKRRRQLGPSLVLCLSLSQSLGLILLGVAGCADPPTPSLKSISPASAPESAPVELTLVGQNLLPRATLELETGTLRVSADFDLQIGKLGLQELRWIDSNTLKGRLPAGLAVGRHDVRLTLPDGQVLQLPLGFEISDATPPVLDLVEPAAGSPVAPAQLLTLRVRASDALGVVGLELRSCVAPQGADCVPGKLEHRDLEARAGPREEQFTLQVPGDATDQERMLLEFEGVDAAGQAGRVQSSFVIWTAADPTGITPVEGPEAGGGSLLVTGSGFDTQTRFFLGQLKLQSSWLAAPIQRVEGGLAELLLPAGQGTVDLIVKRGSSLRSLAAVFQYRPPPTISSLSPQDLRSDLGGLLNLSGTGLNEQPSVTLEGIGPLTLLVITPTRLQLQVPAAGPGALQLILTTRFGQAQATLPLLGAPLLTGTSPEGAPEAGGISVAVLGAGFVPDPSTRIELGTLSIAPSSQASDSLRFLVPPGVGPFPLKVVSNRTPPSLPLVFNYRPPPCLSSASPGAGPVSGGGSVQLQGTGFLPTSVVGVGGQVAPTTFVDASSLLFSPPPALAGLPGTAALEVSAPESGPTQNQVSCQLDYVYNCTPTLLRSSPPAGPEFQSTPLHLLGSCMNADPSMTVEFGGVLGTVLGSSEGELVVLAPPQVAGSVAVAVKSAIRDPMSPEGSFDYVSGAVVTSLSPEDGPLSGGGLLTLNGAAFSVVANYSALFAGQTLPVNFGSATSLSLSLPSASVAGQVDLELFDSAASVSALPFAYRYNPTPSCLNLVPDGAPLSGGERVRVTGVDFLPDTTTRAMFGAQTALSTTLQDSSSLSAISPGGSVPGALTVQVESARHDPSVEPVAGSCLFFRGAPRLRVNAPASGSLFAPGSVVVASLSATESALPIASLRLSWTLGSGPTQTLGVVGAGANAVASTFSLPIPVGTALGTPLTIVPEALLSSGTLVHGAPVRVSVDQTAPLASEGLDLAPLDLVLFSGEARRVEARWRGTRGGLRPVEAGALQWSVDSALLEVSPEGLVHALSPGTAKVLALDPISGKQAELSVRVEASVTSLEPSGLLMAVGQIHPLQFSTRDGSGRVMLSSDPLTVWFSSNPAVVSVDATGGLMALSPGSATISADYASGVASASATLVVGGAGLGEEAVLGAGHYWMEGALALRGLALSPGTRLDGMGASCTQLSLGSAGLVVPAGSSLEASGGGGQSAEGAGWSSGAGSGGDAGAGGGGGGGGSEGAPGGAGVLAGNPGGGPGQDAGTGGGQSPGLGGQDLAGVSGAGASGAGGAFVGAGGRSAATGGGQGAAGTSGGDGGVNRSGSGGGGGDGGSASFGGAGGGGGGGCLEIVSSGDIVVDGALRASGGFGGDVFNAGTGGAGGGGSGGRLLLDAGLAKILLQGALEASGGRGGRGGAGGGGGGGGKVQLRAGTLGLEGRVSLSGGVGGTVFGGGAELGQSGDPGAFELLP